MNEFLLIVLAYLIGSIPSSVWVSKYFFGIDIRDYGSGNAGATNTFRTLGPNWGSFVMVADMLKGIIAVKLVYLLPYYLDHETQMINLQIGLGLAAVVGHIFPIWAEFRGGKGVATVFGMVLGIQPIVAVCCVGVFLLDLYRIFAIAVALMVLITHQKNIGRLLQGNESKVPILKHRDRRRQRRRGGSERNKL